MASKRERRRTILSGVQEQPRALGELKHIVFGSPCRPSDRCTFWDAPAQFALCLDCGYNRGARGSGIVCAHRFGVDPTMVDGLKTQLQGGDILALDEDDA